ncbi:MAG: alcohol dehydrogenase catalytic domain-containing protein [Armatimonadetes bacterium]|nr:alcohol dehydrogenase catalytic domain-containing protein [Armatimonadota bacterium]
MPAAVLHDFDDLRLERVPVPEPADFGDVLVRIRACGVCATDYKAIRGIRRNVRFPAGSIQFTQDVASGRKE